MSNSVVSAAAAVHAKKLVKNEKLNKQVADQKAAHEDQLPADKDQDEAHAVQTREGHHVSTSMSDVSLAGDFTFSDALADAASGAASLVSSSSAQGDGSYGDDDGNGMGGTLLLVGAVALVGLGIAVLASGGGNKNEAPTISASTQAVTTAEDTAKAVTVAATDPDGDVLTYTVTTAAAHGTTSVGAGGVVTYTPAANYNGTDSFVVTAKDPDGLSVTQTVNVTITAVNDAPVADADNTSALTVAEDGSGKIVVAYTDPEGSPVTATIKTNVAHGTLVLGADGDYTYTPAANFNGTDTLVYTVSDGTASFDKTVTITVTAVNDAPVFATDPVVANTDEGAAYTHTLAAADVDGDTLTYTVSTQAGHGTASIANGVLTYTPAANYIGADTFVVTVADGHGGTDTQTYNMAVLTTNVAPAFAADSVTIHAVAGANATGTVAATDANGDALTYAIGDGPDHGTLDLNANGTYTYTPTAGYTGSDSYIVVVADGRGGSDSLTVNVVVDPAQLTVGIDRGQPADAPLTVPSGTDADPANGAVTFNDDANVNTNVQILGFGAGGDDHIHVTNATVSDYSFSTGTGPGGDNDLQIIFNNSADNAVNIILLVDVLDGQFVGSYADAAAQVGYDFMTFG